MTEEQANDHKYREMEGDSKQTKALKFYANPNNHAVKEDKVLPRYYTEVELDYGLRARQVLDIIKDKT